MKLGEVATFDSQGPVDPGSIQERNIWTLMEIHPIRNDEDYRNALRLVSRLVDQDPDPTSPDGKMLDVMATLIETWERPVHTVP
ncbi:MAG: hypothetical protein ACOVT5_13950, partial [Armatimonadaceae bacterium]